MTDENNPAPHPSAKLLRFPQAGIGLRRAGTKFNDLGISELAKSLDLSGRQGTGHWCSRCQGIWYGYMLEVACPKCGGRNG